MPAACVFIAAGILLLVAEAATSTSTAEYREFDYFALRLQWPGSYCQQTRHCCPSNGCCRSAPLTEFTIHGLWPNYNDGGWPSCCSKSRFELNKILSLLPMLQKYWPSLSCGSPSLCHGGKDLFWAHEWEKHGTCSYPIIRDEYSFFSTALDLYFKYNITKILSSAGIQATNSEKYSLRDIVATITNAVGASPLLVCKHGFLQELQLCFYTDFKPRHCLTQSSIIYEKLSSRSSCPQYISFPTYSPLGEFGYSLEVLQGEGAENRGTQLIQVLPVPAGDASL